jgi:hypothetical protein
VTPLHFGVNARSMRRYAKLKVPALSIADLQQCRDHIRFAFEIYRIDCATAAPTMTERRKALAKIKNAAGWLAAHRGRLAAWDLLTVLDTPDLDARRLVYSHLTAKGHNPLQFKKALRHWPIAPRLPDIRVVSAAVDLAALDVDALAPLRPRGSAGFGGFRDPGLANLVLRVVSIWKRVTGRTAGTVSLDKVGDEKMCPFADWLAEMHDLLGVAQPAVGRVIDIVRQIERAEKPAPVTGESV